MLKGIFGPGTREYIHALMHGIIHSCLQVFSHVKSYPEREFFFRLSYIEIYNEVVIDLLDPTKTGLQIRSSEAACSVVKIVGVTEKVVTSAAEVLATVSLGETHRSVGSTDMNEKSSRSHTIFRLVML